MLSRLSSSVGALVSAGLLSCLAVGTAEATIPWSEALTYDHGNWNIWHYPRTTGDVNGDGRADLVGFGHGTVNVALSTGFGTTGETPWVWGALTVANGWQVAHHPRMTGDMNGDGRDDLVGFGGSGVVISLSNGEGFDPSSVWLSDYGVAQGWTTLYHDRDVGDVDGDGRDDVVGFGGNAVLVARSTGAGLTGQEVWSYEMTANDGYVSTMHSRQLGDFDGDGRADVISFTQWGVWVMRSTGNGFEPSHHVLDDFGTVHRGGTAEAPRLVGDVDGDGRDDLVVIAADGVYVALSNGVTAGPATRWLDTFGAQTGWGPQHPRMLADVDGDGRDDVVGFADGEVRVALSRGDRFEGDFAPLPTGDFVTRLQQYSKGMCLTTNGSDPVQRSCDAGVAVGWVLQARGDGTYDVMQDGKCLHAPYGGDEAPVWANPVACGNIDSAWFAERSPEGMLRLRNTYNGGCLRVPGATHGEGERARVMRCDASDHQLWRAETMRPREVVTSLQAGHSDKCLDIEADARIVQRTCNGGASQTFTMVDNGHGQKRFFSHGWPGRCIAISSTEQGWPVNAMPCVEGSPWEFFAMKDLGNGHRLLVSQHSGHCLDVQGSGQWDGTAVLSWPCHGSANQQFTMPALDTTAALEVSLQNVGHALGTGLLFANRAGGYLTRDPVAIVAYLTGAELLDRSEAFEVLSPAQQAAFVGQVGAWDGALPAVAEAAAQIVSVSPAFALGLDGSATGIAAALGGFPLTIAGVAHGDVNVMPDFARMQVHANGFSLSSPQGDPIVDGSYGDPNGSYAGFAGGRRGTSLSVVFPWDMRGQIGLSVSLEVVSVDLYVSEAHLRAVVNFVDDVTEWMISAGTDGFESAWGWSAGAYDSAASAISGFFDDVGGFFESIGDAFCFWC